MNKNYVPKPDWLKIRLANTNCYGITGNILHANRLNTICESGKCPNQGECWSKGTATFMICGDICTRACKFCNTKTGHPLPIDVDEPERLWKSIKLMGLKYVVLTSVDRDDLPDLGVEHWCNCIKAIKENCSSVKIEVLIPDFDAKPEFVNKIIDLKPDVIGHNLETVKHLTPFIRCKATYENSLKVINMISSSGIPAKSGLMAGIGETDEELYEAFSDLKSAGCNILTIGQYLQPTRKHTSVKRYVTPEQFDIYKSKAISAGIKNVVSGVLVRSSYHAERQSSDFCI